MLAVGDLHAENFGIWRDAEGRLAWGVNDFDEAFPLPYTNDLTRLATSVLLAIEGDDLSVDPKQACEAILDGYTKTLESGGRPFVIEEENRWFVPILERKAKAGDPAHFWSHLRESLESQKGHVPASAAAALTQSLPPGSEQTSMYPRRAGVGSLGKPRFVAIARWMGGPVAREVKALTPSACAWSIAAARQAPTAAASAVAKGKGAAASQPASHIPELMGLLTRAGLRCNDPFFKISDGWITRRLARDSRKIELKASPGEPDEIRLLGAMGSETANVHLASAAAVPAIRKDLGRLGHKWLYAGACAMRDATKEEQKAWSHG